MKLTNKQWLLVFILVGALLRLAPLGLRSLWLDEAFSVSFAGRPVAEVWAGNFEVRHPPLYYQVLHSWQNAAGTSEFAVRLPSAIISLLGVGVMYALARRLFDAETALLAAGLLAWAPLDVWYAGEARMYIFVAFAGLLMALGLAWRHPSSFLLTFAGLALGLYFDYTMIPLWAGLTAVWLVYWWVSGRQVLYFLSNLIAFAAAWALFTPWWGRMYALLDYMSNIHTFTRILSPLGITTVTAPQFLLALAVLTGVILVGVAVFYRLLRLPIARRLLLPLFVLAFAGVTLLTPLPRLYIIKRVLVTGWPFIVLLAAWAVLQLPEARRRQAWYGVVGISLLASLALLPVLKDDWRGAAGYLAQNVAAGEIVWIDPSWNATPYNYYRPEAPLNQRGPGALAGTAENAAGIWLISERYPGQPPSVSEGWLDEHWRLEAEVSFFRLAVRYYLPPS